VYFKRDGINVFTELEISPAQAVIGDTVIIKTLDGNKEVQIPAGIQHENFVKIKGAGIPVLTKPSQRGDHIVIIKIKIPTKLSEEEKNLYRRLYELNGGKSPQKSIMSKVKGVFK
jgi:molecular chaperone DnaJ